MRTSNRVLQKWHELNGKLSKYCYRFVRHLPNRGIYVYDEPWDNLIILDACRYDTFLEFNGIEGRLESKISRGSATEEFLLENFSRHPKHVRFPDVVYVAANPYVSWLLPGKFHKIYPVWDYGWDEKLRTVPPEAVVKESLIAKNEHPGMRLVIHFMQPHFPPLINRSSDDTGWSGIREGALANPGRKDTWVDPATFFSLNPGQEDVSTNVLLKEGRISLESVWGAYKENLRIVLEHVAGLLGSLPGHTVISSDHGHLFGERPGLLFPFKTMGHPLSLRMGPLVLVPWLMVGRPNNHWRA